MKSRNKSRKKSSKYPIYNSNVTGSHFVIARCLKFCTEKPYDIRNLTVFVARNHFSIIQEVVINLHRFFSRVRRFNNQKGRQNSYYYSCVIIQTLHLKITQCIGQSLITCCGTFNVSLLPAARMLSVTLNISSTQC